MHHILPVRCDQPPVDLTREERVDMIVPHRFIGTVEGNISPVAHARHQLDPKQARQTEDRLALALRVGVRVSG